MSHNSDHAQQVIMKLAAGQYGVVARFQLLRLGVSSDLVEHRLAAGWLRRLHRGVYLVGPLAVPNSREMAAVLACGGNAVLSRRNAAWVWQLQARPKMVSASTSWSSVAAPAAGPASMCGTCIR